MKERAVHQRTHTRLVHDQVTLQSLHEQLSNEYENLLQERETLKGNLRDVKNESRILRETCERLEGKTKALQTERDTLVTNAKSLNNLRVEHSKLKVKNLLENLLFLNIYKKFNFNLLFTILLFFSNFFSISLPFFLL